MNRVIAIDPGNEYSAYAILDETYHPVEFDKIKNPDLEVLLWESPPQHLWSVIELIGHYGSGMPAGTTVFDTCIWTGRFFAALDKTTMTSPKLIKRVPIKVHHTGSPRAKDSNVSQALKDRFAPGVRNHGKGTKDNPGWFYGFHRDVWQAYALGVYALDTIGHP